MQSGLLLEHTFRLFKQVLGWTTPKLRDPAAADRWTWLIIACHTQLRLARTLAADLRRPWERPAQPGRLTPRPGQARISQHPREDHLPGRRTETRQARPRPPARVQEPPPSPASRRGQEPRQGRIARQRREGDRLNGKLSGIGS